MKLKLDEEMEFIPLSILSVSVESVYDFDLYQDVFGSLKLFRSKNIPISKEDFDKLSEHGHETLYVPIFQKAQLHKHMVAYHRSINFPIEFKNPVKIARQDDMWGGTYVWTYLLPFYFYILDI